MGLFAASAQAGSPQGFTLTPPDPEAIYGGTEVAECGWPTTVSMEGGCTGTLVHPQVVIYAGHCPGVNTVWMGERVNQPWRSLPVEFCRAYPGGQQGTDFAFCKLKAPVLDVPLVPILMGCETELLVPGQQVTIVGYGNADNGPYGIKREVTTTINGIQSDEAFIGGNGKDSCQGDSGGPVYLQVNDGTWRVFGITSYGGECGQGGYYSMMHKGMQWFEQESGIDLTPCHNGRRHLGAELRLPELPDRRPRPAAASGPTAAAAALSGASAPPAARPSTRPPTPTPPTVAIVAPTQWPGCSWATATAQVTVTIEAQDVGWGMKEVQLLINGKAVPRRRRRLHAPYEFKLVVPHRRLLPRRHRPRTTPATWARATPVCIGVNQDAPVPRPARARQHRRTRDQRASPAWNRPPSRATSGDADADGDPGLESGASQGTSLTGPDQRGRGRGLWLRLSQRTCPLGTACSPWPGSACSA
jgi:hypothetical protein